MYNIHSHYENIWTYLRTIVTDPRVLYLVPNGATQPENLERLAQEQRGWWPYPGPPDKRGPLFIFYDQEPIYGEFNYKLFDHIRDNYKGPFVLVTTEKNSNMLDHIKEKYKWPSVYYFYHAFAAHDWFRGSRFNGGLVPPDQRILRKKYISFNRLTSAKRVYRSLLIAEFVQRNILDQGHVSYNEICPEGGHYRDEISQAVINKLIDHTSAQDTIATLDTLSFPLRIDYQQETVIPNHSFSLSAVTESQESFCYLITETCFWESKHHLTEKIFKPIISKMPFILAGPAHNLKYLREYGFKTFDNWWDESYDDVENAQDRLKAIGNTMQQICNYSLDQLQTMLVEMEPILEHNYNLFNSAEFLDKCWAELTNNLNAVETLESFRI
jgi:hypothetical protein